MKLRIMACMFAVLVACSSDNGSGPPPGDTTPPGTVDDLAVTSPPGRDVTLSWTTPGDDGTEGQAAQYALRRSLSPLTEETWSSATPIEPMEAPAAAGRTEWHDIWELEDTTWYFALKTADEVPNWSAISNVVTAQVADVTPPAPITDLRVESFTSHSITLRWTAPGNDGMDGRAAAYDLRYAESEITEDTWPTAITIPGLPSPGPSRSAEVQTVSGPATGGHYYLALRACDEVPNWSALSNVVGVTLTDVLPPDPVADLVACPTAPGSVRLDWTAPGDDGGEGRAARYDIRYASAPIDDSNWEAGSVVADAPVPAEAGRQESLTVHGLVEEQTYYFALRTVDEVPNWSFASNGAGATVATPSLRRLTFSLHGQSGTGNPAWSAQGGRLVYNASWGQDPTQIYWLPAACGPPVQVTHGSESAAQPCWSPDGQQIAFVSRGEIWIARADGGAAPTSVATHPGKHLADPAWSPDGSQIAYTFGDWSASASDIYLVDVSGGASLPWVADGSKNGEVAWSPDGSSIAFVSNRTGDREIWSMPASGGTPLQLTRDPHHDVSPAWSPDRGRIAFVSDRSGNWDIWVMNADGSDPTQFRSDPPQDAQPTWSPDGAEIAFTSNRSGQFEIWIAAVMK